jgi:hypothetical protein
MNKAFKERLVAELLNLGDDLISAEVHVHHAGGVARAIVRKSFTTDQQYELMNSYDKVPSSVQVVNDINFPAHCSV